jgi:hypothetical protein
LILCTVLALQGCLSENETASGAAADADAAASTGAAQLGKGDLTVLAKGANSGKRPRRSTTNTAPTISGTPAGAVVQDTSYGFAPSASDANGDPLTFSISNMPAWATFDGATGALRGTPGAGDVATYANIVIAVSDGQATAQLPAFSIAVKAYTLGSATLSWLPPTQNVDGSPLLNLAGYRVYWGQQSGSYSSSSEVMNPGVTTYVIENLVKGTHYFATTAVNASGIESALSRETSMAIP